VLKHQTSLITQILSPNIGFNLLKLKCNPELVLENMNKTQITSILQKNIATKLYASNSLSCSTSMESNKIRGGGGFGKFCRLIYIFERHSRLAFSVKIKRELLRLTKIDEYWFC